MLGFTEINLTDFFCRCLYKFVIENISLYPDAVMSLFDIDYDYEPGHIHLFISADVFQEAYKLAYGLSINTISVDKVFGGLDQEVINQIGDFTSGFSSYLLDMMDFMSNDTINGAYGYIKQ